MPAKRLVQFRGRGLAENGERPRRDGMEKTGQPFGALEFEVRSSGIFAAGEEAAH
jgi:hypothetical protein